MKKQKKINKIFAESRRRFFGNRRRLKKKTIMSAIQGDPIALMAVVDTYRPYIEALSMREVIDDTGKHREVVDETVKRTLETTLIAAVMKFNPYR